MRTPQGCCEREQTEWLYPHHYIDTSRINSITRSETEWDVTCKGYFSYSYPMNTISFWSRSMYINECVTMIWWCSRLSEYSDSVGLLGLGGKRSVPMLLVGIPIFPKTTETKRKYVCLNISTWNSRITVVNKLLLVGGVTILSYSRHMQ